MRTDYDRAPGIHYGERATALSSNVINRVFGWMTLGLALTGGLGWLLMQNVELMVSLVNSGMMLVCIILELVVVLALSWGINRINAMAAGGLFILYSLLNGVTFSLIFAAYELGSVATVFGITCGTFAGMAAIGFFTRKDLSGVGALCGMGLWGLLVAMLVNLFLQNSSFDYVISIFGVAIFVGLTAWDAQKIKMMAEYYAENDDHATMAKVSIIGALQLYLDFINLFLYLLRLMGRRR